MIERKHFSPSSPSRRGPLAFVDNGDEITIDVPDKAVDLHVPAEKTERSRAVP
ncbi:MAG: dihydroxy-acid dehydratase [Xanthobacteraceae bacterium]